MRLENYFKNILIGTYIDLMIRERVSKENYPFSIYK